MVSHNRMDANNNMNNMHMTRERGRPRSEMSEREDAGDFNRVRGRQSEQNSREQPGVQVRKCAKTPD